MELLMSDRSGMFASLFKPDVGLAWTELARHDLAIASGARLSDPGGCRSPIRHPVEVSASDHNLAPNTYRAAQEPRIDIESPTASNDRPGGIGYPNHAPPGTPEVDAASGDEAR